MAVKSGKPESARNQGKSNEPKEAELEERRYAAPALEKGLDVIELLADLPDGLSRNGIADELGRSVNEIYRMLEVLERRGYIVRRSDGQYVLTLRLYDLSQRHPPTERLLAAAWPALRRLARATHQSCHLAVDDNGTLLNVAQATSPERLTLSVRLGSRYPFSVRYPSARIVAAFQTTSRAREFIDIMLAEAGAPSEATLKKRLASIRDNGFEEAPSESLGGIIDLSAPILDSDGTAIAALTIPYLKQVEIGSDLVEARRELLRASKDIAGALRGGSQRG